MRRLWALLLLLVPALALEAGFKDQDVNGDGTPEKVAVTNLMDLAFNGEGQIVGWYVKTYKGTAFGDYTRAPNLSGNGPVVAPEGFRPERAEFLVEDGRLLARFQGKEGSLTYRIERGRYTVSVEASFPLSLKLSAQGTPKVLLEGQKEALPSGEGRVRYLAWQTRPKAGYALVAFAEEALSGKLVGKEGTLQLAPGKPLRLYGGQNELVRFHVEGLLGLPGLFAPNIWGQLSLGLLWLMETAFRYTGSWGLAILFLTLVVRLLLWPLMHQQFKSMAELQRLQPLIQKINEKYKDDPNKRAEATMKLYQEHKVNPAAGCLPLLIQMPILFILWKVIANYEFGQGLLWIPDLALPDPFYVLPALYVASTFLSTWLSAHGNKDLIRQSLFMNLIFIFLVLQFPSGVTLYWVLSNLIGLVQQWLINRSLKPLAA
ncbi:MAG: YidC/Oxa1 family membrane protein insertase [Thermus sp.]|uniref:YidC/Oxa1 family membrane protein insertase n=1 Tax=Thermus sp. TaxID=275 RepID=UPI0025EFFE86|nr:YidC/Oxa1 family membrane protein insertase [Thermus sp.]MCS6867382.1 YidC/Oxa1 family membrane protein insertase [Thermus sp.]MCS7219127.1 YidC/Oxa1 family membrane protein insertase [Thermus sp.]MCX7850647.1 YidC/Oxa1 family membrane protein insertase [Thermus sp.]MDW8016355.1 YidC/Oxa1 family membrane protein insertase [Thermus sp.]MDW8356442.1 YidC/Oxa1 family membrane protein insertase [Thermus sp.]